jgi:thymidylate synthase
MVKTINSRNVHEAFILGVDAFTWDGDVIEQDSRAGQTLEFEGPVVTTYENPCERVIFWEGRDANPFFHFMEGLWMLQGREDVEFVSYYNKGMEAFTDNGKTFNGAYGYRWRNFYEKDQLDIVVKRLKDNPDDRRCVVAMWECNNDLDRDTLDTPCNTHIYFKVRSGKLNMTVCCRSNDMIWGAYGANAVHFSMLQEYMAARIGVEVGVYNQVSDSFHVYTKLFNEMKEKLPEFDYYSFKYPLVGNPYKELSTYSMVNSPEEFDEDLDAFFRGQQVAFANHFFSDVAVPMQTAWRMHKTDKNTQGAIAILKAYCKAQDWKIACVEWLERRQKGKEETKDIEAVIGDSDVK